MIEPLECDHCHQQVHITRDDVFVTHYLPDDWEGVRPLGNVCPNSHLYAMVEHPEGSSVHPLSEMRAGQWESNRRKH